MMKLKYFFLLIVLVQYVSFQLVAQDKQYVFKLAKQLTAPKMHGRGYVKNGDQKAAKFLASEMKKAGLLALSPGYLQAYSFDVNSFPKKVKASIDKKNLVPGDDFVVNPATASIKQEYELVWLPDTITRIQSVYQFIDTTNILHKMLVIPEGIKNAYRSGIPGVNSLLQTVSGNMWWHVARNPFPQGKLYLKMQKSKLPVDAKTIQIEVENHFLTDRPAYNVAGYVKGHARPDSSVVFVAHYDHLGRMGRKALFPGASDNASGTATVLDLASYYAKHPEKAYYSMVFLLVSGEEAGLMGSKYFADNPLISLEKTKFVINLDMVSTGSEGLSVVNAKQFPDAFAIFDTLNKQNNYFADMRAGGESCNSDHCPFYEKGVPAVFIFTRGKENLNYHNTGDTYSHLTFTAYDQLFGILTGFVATLPNKPSFRK